MEGQELYFVKDYSSVSEWIASRERKRYILL
jgi:hypothetical protein